MGQEIAWNKNGTDIVFSLFWLGWYLYLHIENSTKFNKSAEIWGKKMLETKNDTVNVFFHVTYCFLPCDLHGMYIFK